MKLFIRILLINLLLLSFLNSTELVEKMYNKRYYQYDKYFEKYAKKYDIPFLLLKAIALTENAPLKKDLVLKNKNGTLDLGLMQINTVHMKKFGINKYYLLHPEVNIHAAAILIAEIIKKHGYSWDSIGRYHSKTMKYKIKWVNRVKTHIKQMVKYDKRHNFYKQISR